MTELEFITSANTDVFSDNPTFELSSFASYVV